MLTLKQDVYKRQATDRPSITPVSAVLIFSFTSLLIILGRFSST